MDDMRDYECSAKTSSKGELYMYGKGAWQQYFKDNPDANFIISVQVVPNGSRERMIGYYFAEVLPKCIKGFARLGDNLNKGNAMDRLKKHSQVMWRFDFREGRIVADDLQFEDLNYFEMRRHIDEIIIFAAKHLDIVIENPG